MNRPYTSKVDVFSFAMILYAVFVQENLYQDYDFDTLNEFFVMIIKGEVRIPLSDDTR